MASSVDQAGPVFLGSVFIEDYFAPEEVRDRSPLGAQLEECREFLARMELMFPKALAKASALPHQREEVLSDLGDEEFEAEASSGYERLMKDRHLQDLLLDFQAIGNIKIGEKIEINIRNRLQRSFNGLSRTFGRWMRMSDPGAEKVIEYVDAIAKRCLNILITEATEPGQKIANWKFIQGNADSFQRAYLGLNNLFETYLMEAEGSAIKKPEERQRKILVCRSLNKSVSTLKRIAVLSQMVARQGLDSFTKDSEERPVGSFISEHDFDILKHVWRAIDIANAEYEKENADKIKRLQRLN